MKALTATGLHNVYIKGGLRSPIGVYKGQYKTVRPEVLGAVVVDELMKRCQPRSVDRLLCGNAVAGGGNIGRLLGLMSSLPSTVAAGSVDMQCASTGGALEWGYTGIACGLYETVLAGGVESSSLQPLRTYATNDSRQGSYKVAQFSPWERDELAMLQGAERTIQRHRVTADEMEPWIIRSHQRAVLAREQGILSEYVMSDEQLRRALQEKAMAFDIAQTLPEKAFTDECIRPRMSSRLLRRMPPLLGDGSSVTAGNACLTHDGAAFLLLSHQPSPYRLAAVTSWAGDPLYSPEGAWQATEQLLRQTGVAMNDVDVVEWNEAFAVIDVLFGRAYPTFAERYNRWGGALAYGHPYGASAAIIVLHAMAALAACDGRLGIAAIAGAGGVGTAFLLERQG